MNFDDNNKLEEIYFKEYFECCCSSNEHLMSFEYWRDDKIYSFETQPIDEVMIYVQLNQYEPFYKRIWNGLKYIFGIEDHGCHWAGITIDSKEEINRLQKLLGNKL